ncbi:MAG: ABC transporter permease [Christensenellales bacterium]|jgi:spermidine/putrescine transport system permease protein
MTSMYVPVWGVWIMVACLAGFVLLAVRTVKKNRGIHRSLFAWPYGFWMVVFTVLPLVLIAYYSLTDKNGQFTLSNFANFWDSNYETKQQFVAMGYDPVELGIAERGMVNVNTLTYSIWMAFLCTVISLLLGYPAALIMADRNFKLGATVVVLFVIPMWMNFLLRTIAWMSLLEDNGLINRLLERLGLGKVQLMYNSQAVLLGMVYNYLPFMVFPVYNSLAKQDFRLSEASMDLGADSWKTFWRVTFPLSMPGIVSGITMVFMPSVTTFFIPRVLGGGNTEMFGDLIERTFLTANNWNVGSALSLIMMLLILASLSILRKVDPEGEGGGVI